MSEGAIGLKKTLSGLHLWGIAIGLVISGEYFGWSYGWAQAGTLDFLVTNDACGRDRPLARSCEIQSAHRGPPTASVPSRMLRRDKRRRLNMPGC